MKSKKEQNFDLLEKLRIAAETGLTKLKEEKFQIRGERVFFEQTFITLEELENLKKLLGKVKQATTISEMKLLLNEDTIPIEMVISLPFWEKFQELIYVLSRKKTK